MLYHCLPSTWRTDPNKNTDNYIIHCLVMSQLFGVQVICVISKGDAKDVISKGDHKVSLARGLCWMTCEQLVERVFHHSTHE